MTRSIIYSSILLFLVCLAHGSIISRPYDVEVTEVKTNPTDPEGGSTWVVTWKPPDNVNKYTYITRVYTASNIKYKEHTGLQAPIVFVNGLDEDMNYIVTVTAVQEEGGFQVESPESTPAEINRVSCPNNQVYLPCTSHCVSTCDNPEMIPICNRMCVPGCGCPKNMPTMHEGICMMPFMCPVMKQTIENPRNLRVVSSDEHMVALTWDPVNGASEYKVQVYMASNRYDPLHTQYVPYPYIEVRQLLPDTSYIFRVTAIKGRKASFQPRGFEDEKGSKNNGIDPVNIRPRSLTVKWPLDVNARRYGVTVSEGTLGALNDVIIENTNIAKPEIMLDGLLPGTTYTIGISSAKHQDDLGEEIVKEFTTPPEVGDSPEESVLVFSTAKSKEIVTSSTTEVTSSTTEVTSSTLEMTSQSQGVNQVVVLSSSTATNPPQQLTNCQLAAAEKADEIECREDGNYVTMRCDDVTMCYCIDALDGGKVEGSDFNMQMLEDQDILLDCDQYGSFSTSSQTEIFIQNIFSTEVSFSWGEDIEDNGDILTVFVRLYDEYGAMVKMMMTSYKHDITIGQLSPGTEYKVTVQAVNSNGESTPAVWSNPIPFETLKDQISPPQGLYYKDNRHKIYGTGENTRKGEFEIFWDSNPSADRYTVDIVNEATSEKLDSIETEEDKVTVVGLNPLVPYTIHIRAHAKADEAVVGTSDPITLEVGRLCEDRPMDIIFAIDVSYVGNGRWLNFYYKRKLAETIVTYLPANSRVAVIRYYNGADRQAGFESFTTEDGRFNNTAAGRFFRRLKWNGTMMLEMSDIFDDENMGELLDADTTDSNTTFREDAIPVVVFLAGAAPSINPFDVDDFNKASTLMYSRTHVIAVGASNIMKREDVEDLASDLNLAVFMNKMLPRNLSNRSYVADALPFLKQLLCIKS